jgi:hypothetical protein
MRKIRSTYWLIPVFSLLLLTACNLPFQASAPVQEAPSGEVLTMVAQTVIAELTQTAKEAPAEQVPQPSATNTSPPAADQPTSTLTPTASPEAEVPAEDQPTPTDTLTPESTLPTISASVNTNCRYGPDRVFPVLGYLLTDQTSEVHGKDPYGYWWYIENPEKPGEYCWVWGETTQVEGDTSDVPIKEPPPTPSPTPTDTPTPTPTPTATVEPF